MQQRAIAVRRTISLGARRALFGAYAGIMAAGLLACQEPPEAAGRAPAISDQSAPAIPTMPAQPETLPATVGHAPTFAPTAVPLNRPATPIQLPSLHEAWTAEPITPTVAPDSMTVPELARTPQPEPTVTVSPTIVPTLVPPPTIKQSLVPTPTTTPNPTPGTSTGSSLEACR